MATDVLMPPLSQTMDTLVLVEWLKSEGDVVHKGEPLFLVESDKATLEIEAPASGLLASIEAAAGTEVPVRARVAIIVAPGEQGATAGSGGAGATGAGGAEREPSTPAQASGGAVLVERIALPVERSRRIAASPRARRRAEAEGIPLTSLTPSGPDGLIVERDVMAALRARPRLTPVAARVAAALQVDVGALPASPGERIRRADVEAASTLAPIPTPLSVAAMAGKGEVAPAAEHMRTARPLDPLRRTIARRMQESHHNAVPVTLTREIDATELVALRAHLLAGWPPDEGRLSYTDLLTVIVARCLMRHPHLNGTFDGEMVADGGPVDMALAMDTPRGLLAPVLRGCEHRDLASVVRERGRLEAAALANRLAPADLEGGSFTLSNLGALAIDAFTPVLNPPQIAILGIGRIRSVPMIVDSSVVVRQSLILSLTFDHRVVDGAPAARFLADVAALVEDPRKIWFYLAAGN